LLGLGLDDEAPGGDAEDTLADLFGAPAPAPAPAASSVKLLPLVQASQNAGFEMLGALDRKVSKVVLRLQLRGHRAGFQISINKSFFGFKQAMKDFTPDGSGCCEVPLVMEQGRRSATMDTRGVQTAMKPGQKKPVFFFVPWDLNVLASPGGLLQGKAFMQKWSSLPAEGEVNSSFGGLKTVNTTVIRNQFSAQNIFFVRNFTRNQVESMFFSMKLLGGLVVLLELKFKQGFDGCKMCLKTTNQSVGNCLSSMLRSQLMK